MARYEIVFHNGYGREIDSMVVEAASMAVALTLSGNLLRTGAVRNGEQAASAAVELQGVYDQEYGHRREEELRRSGYGPDDPLTAGLHSVRAELHEDAGLLDLEQPLPRVGGVDMAAVGRLEAFAQGEAAPSTGTED